MKNKQLEKLFLEYVNQLSNENADMQIKETEVMWVLFGEEDFHINRKTNTLYIKPIALLIKDIFTEEYISTGVIEWVAYQKNMINLESKVTVGVNNPFINNSLATQNIDKFIVKAIPYQYAKKAHKQYKTNPV